MDLRGDSGVQHGVQLPNIDPTRQYAPGVITLPSTEEPRGFMVARNVIWVTIYTDVLERNFRTHLIRQTNALIIAHNTLEVNSHPGNERHLIDMELKKTALNHMAYLYYKTLGVELSTEQLSGVQNSFILRKILNTEIQKSRDYLNKLENMNLEHHTSNP